MAVPNPKTSRSSSKAQAAPAAAKSDPCVAASVTSMLDKIYSELLTMSSKVVNLKEDLLESKNRDSEISARLEVVEEKLRLLNEKTEGLEAQMKSSADREEAVISLLEKRQMLMAKWAFVAVIVMTAMLGCILGAALVLDPQDVGNLLKKLLGAG